MKKGERLYAIDALNAILRTKIIAYFFVRFAWKQGDFDEIL